MCSVPAGAVPERNLVPAQGPHERVAASAGRGRPMRDRPARVPGRKACQSEQTPAGLPRRDVRRPRRPRPHRQSRRRAESGQAIQSTALPLPVDRLPSPQSGAAATGRRSRRRRRSAPGASSDRHRDRPRWFRPARAGGLRHTTGGARPPARPQVMLSTRPGRDTPAALPPAGRFPTTRPRRREGAGAAS